MIATLPMYDWPEIRPATDAMWACLRDLLRAEGLDAPETLSRGGEDEGAGAGDAPVLFGQTCGLPFVRDAHPGGRLLGRPDYGVEGWSAGTYRSAIVVRASDGTTIANLAGRRFAANGVGSLSGWLAAHDFLGPEAVARVEITGAHRDSIRAVAAGAADFAAIDAFCLHLARRWDPAMAALKVIAWTPPRPAMPFFCGPEVPPATAARIAECLQKLPAALPGTVREDIPLRAVYPTNANDFQPIAALWAAANG